MLKLIYKFGIDKLLKNELIRIALIYAINEVFKKDDIVIDRLKVKANQISDLMRNKIIEGIKQI